MAIDPSARIAPEVELAPDVSVGPGVIIDGPSRIGAGCRILAHAYIGPYTTMGEDNLIGFGAVIGYDPQDYAFTGEESYTLIGHHNLIREYVTIHRGTKPGSATRVGNHNFLMALSHMAHNSSLGDHVVLVNGALVGGYVEVADRAFISANCLLHQFIRVGTLVMMRGGARASRDLPPFCNIDDTHTVKGLNLVGLRRAGFSREQIAPLRQAVRILFGTRMNLKLALERVEAEVPLTPEVAHLLEFIRSSKRGVAVGSGQGHDAEL
ncbi:MAG: acyl-[acyl-carrier-protein]--UDP-N-acetylglucosamine O-acyltransferase [Desulfobacca sp. RBG_16_58_9]|nr:MAG: acyl-[acyl-carrier-protein]--UDP-N-acetylglucosamine O-acyltransferase [Desulfobacca sp. RBG_16_58_9]